MLPAEVEPTIVPQTASRLARGGAIAVLARGIGIVLSMGTGIITARALGPEGKGVLAFLSAASALAVRTGSLGIDGSFAHFYLARRRPLAECLGAIAWIGAGSAIIVTIGCELALFAWPALRGASPLSLSVPFFAATPAFFLLFVSTFVFFGLGREASFAAFDVGYRAVLMLSLALSLTGLHGRVRAAVWVQIAVSISFAMIAVVAVGRELRWKFAFRRELVPEMLRYGVRYYSYGLLRYALCYGGILVAGLLLTSKDTGLFAVSLMLGEGLILFASSINLAFYPAVATSVEPHHYTAVAGKRIVALSFVLAVVLALVARPLIQIVYGPAFLPSVVPFLIMLPALVLLSAEQVTSSYFAARGMPWSIVVIFLIGVTLGVVSAARLSGPLGLMGVAVAAAGAQAFVSIAVLVQFWRAS